MPPERKAIGRSTTLNPPGRFERIEFVERWDDLDEEEALEMSTQRIDTQYFVDDTKSIISENQSPDLPFRFSLNPYRGCAHGCAYCYARPSHEFLGMNAGLDFESKVMVKTRAPKLLRQWLRRASWNGELIIFSGVTDCYQPIERQLKLTRQCLEVAWEARQAVSIVTKNALVTRDIDVLQRMAQENLVRVALSITSLDQSLTRVMEPRTSAPRARLRALAELASAGVPTHAMVAPIIPGINECEIPAILEAVAQSGARTASHIVVRLPDTVRVVFLDWLARTQKERASKVIARINSIRQGGLNDSRYGSRMRGEGQIAEQIAQMFTVFANRYGLERTGQPVSTDKFRRPGSDNGQLRLFD